MISDYARLSDEIEANIHRSVLQIQPVSGTGSAKNRYFVRLADGTGFLYKEVHFSDAQFRSFSDIQAQHIPQFQKTACIWPTDNNGYAFLAEWTPGTPLDVLNQCADSASAANRIRSASEAIRKIHTDFQTGSRISWSAEDIKTRLNRCCLPDIQKQEIFQYTLPYLPIINSRYATVVHGDLHLGNIIAARSGIRFIDMDNACYGDAYSDLSYAANIHRTSQEEPLYYLFLQDYFKQHIPDDFWPIVNFYSIFKALSIMQSETDASPTHSFSINIEPLLALLRDGLFRKPSWYLHIESRSDPSGR